jgi:multidrug transporter EmrE-like cation transporter
MNRKTNNRSTVGLRLRAGLHRTQQFSNRPSVFGYILIILFLFINAATQIVFKKIALGPGGSNYPALITEPLFYMCGLLFFCQAVVWLGVWRQMPLSRAYPFSSLTMIILLANGALFFDETITLGNLLGAIAIMIG